MCAGQHFLRFGGQMRRGIQHTELHLALTTDAAGPWAVLRGARPGAVAEGPGDGKQHDEESANKEPLHARSLRFTEMALDHIWSGNWGGVFQSGSMEVCRSRHVRLPAGCDPTSKDERPPCTCSPGSRIEFAPATPRGAHRHTSG